MTIWPSVDKKEFRTTHPCIMPEKQPKHNYPHGGVMAYFNAIFATDFPEYKGMVAIAARDRGSDQMRMNAVVPAEQMGEWAAKMHVSTQLDYYYGRARHSGNATWGTNRTFAFDTINVDVDCHNGCTDMPSGQGGGG